MEELLKYKKLNWLKLKANLYDYGVNDKGWGYVTFFFQKKKMLHLSCHAGKVDELKKERLVW